MSKILLTIFKVLLIVILVLAALAGIAVGIYYLMGYTGWPLWSGFALFIFIVLAILVGYLFIRRVIFRRREEGFVKRVIEQEDTQGGRITERQQVKDLQARWNLAISSLKSSHLKKKGKPGLRASLVSGDRKRRVW